MYVLAEARWVGGMVYFFVRRALEVTFVGLEVSHVWNISSGK